MANGWRKFVTLKIRFKAGNSSSLMTHTDKRLTDLQENQEIELLLSISADFVSTRDADDLLTVVTNRLRDLIGFHHIHISTIDEEEKTVTSYIADPLSTTGFHPLYSTRAVTKLPIDDAFIERSYGSAEPVYIDLEQLKDNTALPFHFRIVYDTGIRQVVIMRLLKTGTPFGFWFLLFNHADPIDQDRLRLIKGISHQISSAVSNIINNEDIRRREDEKTRILAFSKAIASVRDRETLSKIIKVQLAELFNIKEYCFWLLTPDRMKRKPFLFDCDAQFVNHPSFQKVLKEDGYLDNNDNIFDRIIRSNEILFFDIEDLETWEVPHPLMDVITSMKMTQMGGNMVRIEDEDIGIISFTHDNMAEMTTQYRLYESICSQLAIVVSNLHNNEQIKIKEEETARILAFSNAIASVREKDVLAKILRAQLGDIFGMIDYCIWLNHPDQTKRIAFLYDKDTPIALSPLFYQGLDLFTSSDKYTSSDDYIFQKALESDEDILLDSSDWRTPDQPGYVYAEYANEFNFEALGASRIRLGDENLAVIIFSYNTIPTARTNHRFYRGIFSQLALTLSNLLATEKVNEQLVEINRYKQQLEDEKTYLQEEIAIVHNASEIVGSSPAINEVFGLIKKVASSNTTVLLLGETGTGKEVMARAIHTNSERAGKLMVKVNCAALPTNLIESELFGHERGSFTGAHDRRIGKFELANHGTLFLDEIGEMPLDLQVKLLRVLQEKEIERIGGKGLIKVDVRIIASTNRNLENEVKEGRFREDLFYRLNIFPIQLPSLRERAADIPMLVNHFIEKFSKKSGKRIKGVSNAVMKEMQAYSWPGNIRELEHFIERSLLLATSETITNVTLRTNSKATATEAIVPEFKARTLDGNERELILKTLAYCGGQISGPTGAAQILGVPPTTLHSKMKKLGIVKRHTEV
jgi:formate hydrogenlyase transcriptional activator